MILLSERTALVYTSSLLHFWIGVMEGVVILAVFDQAPDLLYLYLGERTHLPMKVSQWKGRVFESACKKQSLHGLYW
jgi:hypothetical protein